MHSSGFEFFRSIDVTRPTAVALAILVGSFAVGCTTEAVDVTVEPETPLPTEVATCDSPSGTNEETACLDEIETFLDRQTKAWAAEDSRGHEAFLNALDDLNVRGLALAVGTSWEYSYDPPIVDASQASSTTTPISTSWRVGSQSRVLWTCFTPEPVVVSVATCSN